MFTKKAQEKNWPTFCPALSNESRSSFVWRTKFLGTERLRRKHNGTLYTRHTESDPSLERNTTSFIIYLFYLFIIYLFIIYLLLIYYFIYLFIYLLFIYLLFIYLFS